MGAPATQAPARAHQTDATPAAKRPGLGSTVLFVLSSDGEHEPTVRAALVTGYAGHKLNLAVLLDGDDDYAHIELGNMQLSAANREGALLTTLRRAGVAYDPEGLREGTWHQAKG